MPISPLFHFTVIDPKQWFHIRLVFYLPIIIFLEWCVCSRPIHRFRKLARRDYRVHDFVEQVALVNVLPSYLSANRSVPVPDRAFRCHSHMSTLQIRAKLKIQEMIKPSPSSRKYPPLPLTKHPLSCYVMCPEGGACGCHVSRKVCLRTGGLFVHLKWWK